MLTSGQTEEDARRIAEGHFPVPGTYKEFTFWECYLVLKDYEKFWAGCDARWPEKKRLNYSGDNSGSSGGSHDLPPDAKEFPSLPSFTRCPRPVGQKRAQRAARGSSPLSPQEVERAAGLVCGSPFFFKSCIFFIYVPLFFNEMNEFSRICLVNLIP